MNTIALDKLDLIADTGFPCPFSILKEFPKWFEWHKRVHFQGVDSFKATADMSTLLSRRVKDMLDLEVFLGSDVYWWKQRR